MRQLPFHILWINHKKKLQRKWGYLWIRCIVHYTGQSNGLRSTTKNNFTNWMANKKQVPDMTPVFFYQISASESDSFVSI